MKKKKEKKKKEKKENKGKQRIRGKIENNIMNVLEPSN